MKRIFLLVAALAGLSACGRPNFHAGAIGGAGSDSSAHQGIPGPSGAGTTVGQEIVPAAGGTGGGGGGGGGGGTTAGNPGLIQVLSTDNASDPRRVLLCFDQAVTVKSGRFTNQYTMNIKEGAVDLRTGALRITVREIHGYTFPFGAPMDPRFTLKPGCANNRSAEVSNANGDFSSSDPIGFHAYAPAVRETSDLALFTFILDFSPALNRLKQVNMSTSPTPAEQINAAIGTGFYNSVIRVLP